MSPSCTLSLSDELSRRGEAFEAAMGRDPGVDLAPFLPPREHPLYLAILAELIRLDIANPRAGGARRRLADYTSRFPALLENTAVLQAVALQEYTQRRRAGEAVTPA